MAWISKSEGIFRLRDSDSYCGSYISVDDATEILGVNSNALDKLPKKKIDNELFISELDLHRKWGAGEIIGAHPSRIGNAKRSLDELIIIKLLELTLDQCEIEPQMKFGRKYVDIKFSYKGKSYYIEFVGPTHFVPYYNRGITSPFERKKKIEDYFGSECIIWPFWIQRCSKNIRAIVEEHRIGLASVWSTKAFFGDFVLPNSAQIIIEISKRFGALKENGIGYMYGNGHTNKPIHPIIEEIKNHKQSKERLIPYGNENDESFWLPQELY